MATARVFRDGTYAVFAPAHDEDRFPWEAYAADNTPIGARWGVTAIEDGVPTVLREDHRTPPAPAGAEHEPPPAPASAGPTPQPGPAHQATAPGFLEGLRRFVPGDPCPEDLEAVLAPGRQIWTRPEWDGSLALLDWPELVAQSGTVIEVPTAALEHHLQQQVTPGSQ